jgi:hypothetical protein
MTGQSHHFAEETRRTGISSSLSQHRVVGQVPDAG